MDTQVRSNIFSIGNAAGPGSKTIQQIVDLLEHPLITEPLLGSITFQKREGKPNNVLYHKLISINAVELYGPGSAFYAKALPDLGAIAQSRGKRLRLSLAPFTVEEVFPLVSLCKPAGRAIAEFNASCPHVGVSEGQDTYHPPLCYTSSFGHFLFAFAEICEVDCVEGWVKVSPYLDARALEEAAFRIKATRDRFPTAIQGVVVCNALPLCFEQDEHGEPALDSPLNLGSAGGNGLYPLMRGNLRLWQKFLGPSFRYIAVGGVNSGRRIRECRELGACGVQIGTPYFHHGIGAFEKIQNQLLALEMA